MFWLGLIPVPGQEEKSEAHTSWLLDGGGGRKLLFFFSLLIRKAGRDTDFTECLLYSWTDAGSFFSLF